MSDNPSVDVSNQKPFIKSLYCDASIFYDDELLEEATGVFRGHRNFEELTSRVNDKFPVLDPRYIGYEFPSYTFIETKNHLEEASKAKLGHFNRRDKVQLLGTVLGDVDLIHRRVDEHRWANAEFAKWAKERLSFFEQFETYPIFQIARWYGKDIQKPIKANSDSNGETNNKKTLRQLTSDEKAVIEAIDENPELLRITEDTTVEANNIRAVSDLDDGEISNIIEKLKGEEILLGSSITYNISRSPWQCAFMGLSLGPEEEPEENEPRMDLEVDHNHVIDELQKGEGDVPDEFTMPFITSGVGQGWADIFLELRIEEMNELDEIAQAVRDISYVESTKTYMMTNTIINEYNT